MGKIIRSRYRKPINEGDLFYSASHREDGTTIKAGVVTYEGKNKDRWTFTGLELTEEEAIRLARGLLAMLPQAAVAKATAR